MSQGWEVGHCEDHFDKESILNAIFQLSNEFTKGGETMFYDNKACDRGYSIACRNLRAILAPFNRLYHCATPWKNGRACIGK